MSEGEAGVREPASTRASALAAALVFASLALYGLYRIQFGVDDLKDEGFYLSTPLRYALGDLPFRDEILNPVRMFDIVLAPAFMLFPNLGVYELRLGWLVVQLASVFSLFILLRRFSSDFVVALACGVVVWVPNMIWTPGYHTMGAVFFVLAWSCWLRGCLAGRPRSALALGLLAGLCFCVGAISYLPLLAILAVPGIVLIGCWARRDPGSCRALATLMLLIGATVGMIGFVQWVIHMELIREWWYASRALTSVPHYAQSTGSKLSEFFRDYLVEWRIWLGTGVSIFVMGVSIRKSARHMPPTSLPRTAASLLIAAVMVVVVAALITHGQIGVVLDRHDLTLQSVSAVFGIYLGVAALRLLHRKRVVSTQWRLVSLSLGFGAMLFALLQGILSTHSFKCMIAIVPLMANGVVLAERSLAACGSGRHARFQARLYAIALSLTVGLATLPTISDYVYSIGAKEMALQTEPFELPLLRGLYGTPAQVRRVEAVTGYLTSRLDRGDYLLVYDNASLYYYLTRTRPAIDHAWTYRVIPANVRQRSIEKMIAADRIPTYVVQNIDNSSITNFGRKDPIHSLVLRYYEVEARFNGIKIWRLASDRADVEPVAVIGERWRAIKARRRAKISAKLQADAARDSAPDTER